MFCGSPDAPKKRREIPTSPDAISETLVLVWINLTFHLRRRGKFKLLFKCYLFPNVANIDIGNSDQILDVLHAYIGKNETFK